MASSGVTQTIESLFGPPSDLIYIEGFIKSSEDLLPLASTSSEQVGRWDANIEQECSVDDIKQRLERMLDDPVLSAQMVKEHETAVNAMYSTMAKNKKPGRKVVFPDPPELSPEVLGLRKELDGVKLKSWKLNAESVMFVRPPRNSDYNSVSHIKPAHSGGEPTPGLGAVITVSIYNKIPWGPSYVSRVCQHAYLSRQTLHDIYETLPCIYSAVSSGSNPAKMKPGCVMCIENVLYSDETDCSNQIIVHLSTTSKATARPTVSQRTILDTTLSSLSLRLNLPYPILHAGNCEHFMVVDQIRLWHPSDPVVGYPQTLQITPPLPSLCYACRKVPASLSVVGDVKLGESPSLVCGPCWNGVGLPAEESVVVTPLPLSYS